MFLTNTDQALDPVTDFQAYLTLIYETTNKNDVTSVVKFCMENTSRRRVFSVNFDQACDVIFMVSK